MSFVPSRGRARSALTAGVLVVVAALLVGCLPAAENGPRVPQDVGPTRTGVEGARLLHDAEQGLLARACAGRAGAGRLDRAAPQGHRGGRHRADHGECRAGRGDGAEHPPRDHDRHPDVEEVEGAPHAPPG